MITGYRNKLNINVMNIDRIFDRRILEELNNYRCDSIIQAKALRVYMKCMSLGKYEMASRIKNKYFFQGTIKSDRIISFGLALFSRKYIYK